MPIARPSLNIVLATAAAVALSAMVSGCSARKEVRGNYLTDAQLSTIQPGTTNRETVLRMLGPPSTEGTFDKQVWYYIGRQTEEWAFLNPEILEQKVVALYFNGNGVVEHIERYSENDARRVDVVERETPTSGHKIGFFEQILGNLGVLGTGGGG
jgi:outer membrane protein assembly factor BamE (lipoprotein component of BamABCDE complex)